MPSVKRAGVKAQTVKTGFESYDGPEPTKRGMYRAKVTQLNFKTFRTGSQGFAVLAELEAAPGDPKGHAQFDGYPIWSNVVFGDKEQSIIREGNFYDALGVSSDPNIVFEDGDLEAGVKVKTLGGKNVLGKYVNADIKIGSYNGEPRPEVDGIYKIREEGKASAKASVVAEIAEDEEEDESEVEESEDGAGYEERKAELLGAKIADLREIAESDYDLEIKGLKKADLVEAILEQEFGDEDEEEDDEAEDEEEPDDEEEEGDEEEEEDDEDERAEREAELSGLTRIQLKSALAKVNADFRVLKRHTEQDLISAILDAEFGDGEETPF